jgi:hypothetical protein
VPHRSGNDTHARTRVHPSYLIARNPQHVHVHTHTHTHTHSRLAQACRRERIALLVALHVGNELRADALTAADVADLRRRVRQVGIVRVSVLWCVCVCVGGRSHCLIDCQFLCKPSRLITRRCQKLRDVCRVGGVALFFDDVDLQEPDADMVHIRYLCICPNRTVTYTNRTQWRAIAKTQIAAMQTVVDEWRALESSSSSSSSTSTSEAVRRPDDGRFMLCPSAYHCADNRAGVDVRRSF